MPKSGPFKNEGIMRHYPVKWTPKKILVMINKFCIKRPIKKFYNLGLSPALLASLIFLKIG